MTAVLEAPEHQTPAPATTGLQHAPVPVPMPALRETTPQDHLRAAFWGIASALAAATVSVLLLLPIQVLPVTFLLGAGLGMLGYLDQITHTIRNQHTALFATAAAVLLAATQVSQGGFVLGWALICAAAVFVFMILVALTAGSMGGGDVKLAPVAAALLAAVSPLAVLLWVQFLFIGAVAGALTARFAGQRKTHLAMVPYMAVAVLPALAGYGVLGPILGV
jgi:leader peptidase (prepilin peptidase)/N-methyltransferase